MKVSRNVLKNHTRNSPHLYQTTSTSGSVYIAKREAEAGATQEDRERRERTQEPLAEERVRMGGERENARKTGLHTDARILAHVSIVCVCMSVYRSLNKPPAYVRVRE